MKRSQNETSNAPSEPDASAREMEPFVPSAGGDAVSGGAGKKERILRAAQAMFGRHGFANTTMKMIAEEAGVAFGLVAHHFGGKENLFITAGFDMIGRLLTRVREEASDAESGYDALTRFIRAYLRFTLDNPETFPVLIRCSPFGELGGDDHKALVAEKFDLIFDEIAAHLKRGMDDGSIRLLPVRKTALLLYGNILTAVRTHFITPYKFAGLYEETLRYVQHAVANPEGLGREAVFRRKFQHLSLID
ncbi:MAG: TetR/AcrR family transcriptional regulator [Desulfovibrio sp.]